MTPYVAGFERKPNVFHFKIFGCLLYVKVIDEKRKKLDAKSQASIFIGYCEHSKAYRFHNPKTHKIIVYRDAIFDEEEVWGQQKLFVHDGSLEESSTNAQPCVQPSHVQLSKVQPGHVQLSKVQPGHVQLAIQFHQEVLPTVQDQVLQVSTVLQVFLP